MGSIILNAAYQAKDGTIFETKEECEQYESSILNKSIPMLTIENENLVPTDTVTDVHFVYLNSQVEKDIFIEARQDLMNLIEVDSIDIEEMESIIDNLKNSYKYSCEGLNDTNLENNEAEFGVFAITNDQENFWKWIPIQDYISEKTKQLESAQESIELLTNLYLVNNR